MRTTLPLNVTVDETVYFWLKTNYKNKSEAVSKILRERMEQTRDLQDEARELLLEEQTLQNKQKILLQKIEKQLAEGNKTQREAATHARQKMGLVEEEKLKLIEAYYNLIRGEPEWLAIKKSGMTNKPTSTSPCSTSET